METGYKRLLSIGRFHAVHYGLDADSAEDCAIEFVEKMLKSNPVPVANGIVKDMAWVHRCASNFARNYVRHIVRRKRHEVCCSLLGDESALDNPQAVVLQNEFWQKLFVAVNLLSPRQKAYFCRHYMRGETSEEIAGAYHCTEHSVEQALLRARQRLRILLAQQEGDEAALREYLLPPPF